VSLSLKLTLALSSLALVLVAGIGVWQLRSEEADLKRAVQRDVRLLGRSLQVAFENALRDRQGEDVEETLRALERIAPEVDVFVYDSAGVMVAASTGARASAQLPRAVDRDGSVAFIERGGELRAQLRLPLRIESNEPPATLLLVRPLADMARDLENTRARIASTLIAFVVAVALLSLVLARYWVGTPLAQMIAHMRRVRTGDLSQAAAARPGSARSDEIGQTLGEFDALVHDLRDARERLTREVESRRRLEEGLRDVDKLATLGQLAAGLAHDIGSPLQVLEGRIAALEHKAHDGGEVRRISAILLEQTQRITRIVSRLTSLARRRPRRARSLDGSLCVRSVVDLLEVEAQRRGVTLLLEAPPLPPIVADGDLLQQLALNLIRNALDATSRGGYVTVRLSASSITHADGTTRASLRVAVEDDGRGMDEETCSRAFEPFFTTRSELGGTGLGLAVVKGIVDDHGGRIEVRSTPGAGASFVVDLPLDAPNDAEVIS